MKISCIIPAYNEGSRIDKVLDIITNHPDITEVIVVDDASSDNTNEVVSSYKKVKLISHKVNQGKSKAIYDGVLNSSGSHILFIDSDLIGLTLLDITKLITPVLKEEAYVSISLRKNSPKIWRLIKLDYISGERLLPRRILDDDLDKIATLPKFGLEVFLNDIIIREKLRIKIVDWPKVESPFKSNKYGWWVGLKGDFFMIFDIIKTVSVFRILYQIIKLKKLEIK